MSIGDIVAAHAAFGTSADVIRCRRATYLTTIELLAGGAHAASLGSDVIDDPLVRHHLGEVLSGETAFDPGILRQEPTVADPTSDIPSPAGVIRLAATSASPHRLAGAAARVGAEIDSSPGAVRLVVRSVADDGFVDDRENVLAGIELAVERAPELARDLLQHVSLFAVLGGPDAGRIASASAREYPGLILLPAASSPVEVAEGLIHEGAHQLFFDLAITRAFLDVTGPVPRFRPSWAADDAVSWPFEQAVAAFHAYVCLAALADRFALQELHSYSLMPHAKMRSAEIGDWIDTVRDGLGVDGRRFVGLLQGRRPESDSDSAAGTARLVEEIRAEAGPMVVRRCGVRSIVGVRVIDGVHLYWLPSEIAAAVER